MKNMKTENVLKLILKMGMPMVISMMVNSLYNIVDSLFVAKMSENAMTALSLVFPIQNLISSIMIGFGIGINAVVSFYLGAGDRKRADKAASQGLFLGTVHGLVFTVIGITVMPWFLRMFTDDSEILSLGVQYTNVVFAFSVALSWELVFEKTFQAVGRMTASMVCMLAGCIVNIILDRYLYLDLARTENGIEGAALATGIGQSVCAIAYIILYIVKPISVKYKKEYMIPQKDMCKRLYAIGIPASLSLALPSLLISALNVILAAFSQTYVFVLGVYYKLQTFLYLPANGIVQGMRPLIGYNYGAGEHKRVEEIYRTSLVLVALIMAAGTILCFVFPGELIGLFTTNADTISAGRTALRIIGLGFIVSSVSVASSGALEGLGKGGPSLVISALRYVAVIIPAAFIIKPYYRSSRSMACILDNRINNSGSIILYICPFKIKINEKESVICVQQQLIRQKIFIWEGHLIMNSHMAKK